MGKKLGKIIFDRMKDNLYQDDRGMTLTPYVMAERCLQVEVHKILNEHRALDWGTLVHILSGGFKGFQNMDSRELIEEYTSIEEEWYNLYETEQFEFEAYEEDPINKLKEEA
jgi:hypothetical protein